LKTLSEPSAPDLRALLRDAPPGDFPLKKAWRELIRAAREHKRATGQVLLISSLAGVERAQNSVPCDPGVAERIKPLLRALQRGEAGSETAAEIDAQLRAALPRVQESPVRIEIEDWPEGFDGSLRARLLRRDGPPPYVLPPGQAAAMHHEFAGMVIAGKALRLTAGLDEGRVLPPVPRSLRRRPQPRGRQGPWLPYWDTEGRRYLTPQALAIRTAAELRACGVTSLIDGCAGLGGNSICFVRAGISVIAVDADRDRLELAQRNASALNCGDLIDWRGGRIEDLLPSLPDLPIFLDPPWQRASASLPPWLPLSEGRPTVLKAPAAFDPASLPGTGWRVQYEFGEAADDDSVLKMLTIWRL
jgi:hypothetical protein